ncbi:hypothetical protein BDY21DRAFT_362218 [Lineolata rhizophorae]|uniref:Uncharacterized protein n=1 Tax=Lineolata rhizophorae TaxID=578093 RepID=A0A6A6P6R6_9PEZI|nr:hypothetical protein BDY21DRAFT_362218 [Lineolata rhizophorae]
MLPTLFLALLVLPALCLLVDPAFSEGLGKLDSRALTGLNSSTAVTEHYHFQFDSAVQHSNSPRRCGDGYTNKSCLFNNIFFDSSLVGRIIWIRESYHELRGNYELELYKPDVNRTFTRKRYHITVKYSFHSGWKATGVSFYASCGKPTTCEAPSITLPVATSKAELIVPFDQLESCRNIGHRGRNVNVTLIISANVQKQVDDDSVWAPRSQCF